MLQSKLCWRRPFKLPTQTCSEEALERAVRALRPFPGFDLSDPLVLELALLAHSYLVPWLPQGGHGPGRITPTILEAMSRKSKVVGGACHIRIVRGKIFYRFPDTVDKHWRFNRMVGILRMLNAAIRKFGLQNLSAEIFLNTQSQPMSFDSTSPVSGYPVWSAKGRMDALDILYPDTLDLYGRYVQSAPDKFPWGKKKSIAYFRGGANCYPLHNDTNWKPHPRFNLHKHEARSLGRQGGELGRDRGHLSPAPGRGLRGLPPRTP